MQQRAAISTRRCDALHSLAHAKLVLVPQQGLAASSCSIWAPLHRGSKPITGAW